MAARSSADTRKSSNKPTYINYVPLMRTFSAVFAHPESHGPQICAIHMLAGHSETVDVLFRNVDETHWKFPSNVSLKKDGPLVAQQEVYKKNILVKSMYFLRFTSKMIFHLLRKKYDLIVLFDPLAFYSFSLIYKWVPGKPIIWYHSYDIVDLSQARKYSYGWFANWAPKRIFSKIDYFTLPMEERLVFFPLELLKRPVTILPNYSMPDLHSANRKTLGETLRLVFVGTISPGHGLEQLIELLGSRIEGKKIELVLKGYLQEEYKEKLLWLAEENGVLANLTILSKGPWQEVPEVLRTGHVGIAIYQGKDLMNSTLGKGGSGKIYQYIAEGLPVLINQEIQPHFKEYPWAVPTVIDQEGLVSSLAHIIRHYDELSGNAVTDFKQRLNCNLYYDEFFNRMLKNEHEERA